MIPKRLVLLMGACAMVALLWPSDALAQRRGGHVTVPARTAVVVHRGVGFSRPFYGSSFYARGFFYDPLFYDPFLWGYYPYYYGAYAGPYEYGYGYGYGGYGAWSAARLEIKPREAQVYLDGYYVGIVDQFDGIFQRLDIPAGEHDLVVYLQGYRTYRQRTYFQPGQTYHFKAILEPLAAGTATEPPPQPAPRAAGQNQPPSPPQYRQPYGRPYPPQGYPPQGGNYPPPQGTMEPNGGGQMPDRPMRGNNDAGFGTLSVRVQPGDATVTIDGERWDSPDGGSRLQVQLSAGSHRIEVRKDGYRPYSSTIQIRPGDTQSLNISLPSGS